MAAQAPVGAPAEGEEGGGLSVSGMIKEIQGLKDKFKNEDEEARESSSRALARDPAPPPCMTRRARARASLAASPFQDLEKATVLQECRMFHDAKVVTENPRKCCMLITKLLHIVTQGDELSSTEVTEVFFGVTKLFQSNDMNLRR